MKRNRKGFTLVELIITITVIIILSSISVPMYKAHTKNAILAEGYVLLSTMREAQRQYYSEYGNFLRANDSSSGEASSGFTCNEEVLGIDARGNKYFTWFQVGYYNTGGLDRLFGCGAMLPPQLARANANRLLLQYNISLGQRIIFYPEGHDSKWTS